MQSSKQTSLKAPTITTIAASAILCISGFLPYTVATGDLSSFIQGNSGLSLLGQSSLTIADLQSPSLFSWATIFFAADLDQGNGSVVLSLVIWAAGLFSLLSLLFSALRKATPSAIFALLSIGTLAMISSMFDGALLTNGIYQWGFGHTLGFISAFLTIASSIWLFVAKRSAKTADQLEN